MLPWQVLCKPILTWRNPNRSRMRRSQRTGPIISLTICHRSKPGFTDFLRTHGSNVAREGGSQRSGVSRLNGATVPPALRSCACKPIFRSVRSYFFLFQHVCASRMPGSEGFRHGNLSRQRIVGVLGTLLFQIFALENLFLRRDRRKWNSVPDRKPEERISL